MKSKENWVVIGPNRDRERKGKQSVKLARAKECKRCQEIFGPCKLLQKVYQRFCSSSQTNEHVNKKGYKVAVRAEATTSV